MDTGIGNTRGSDGHMSETVFTILGGEDGAGVRQWTNVCAFLVEIFTAAHNTASSWQKTQTVDVPV